jgi:hypothetical protein
MTNNRRLSWGIMMGLALIYVVGLLLGWANFASWHLLLVIVAILFLYNIFNLRGQGKDS